jgi:hypothetical protein
MCEKFLGANRISLCWNYYYASITGVLYIALLCKFILRSCGGRNSDLLIRLGDTCAPNCGVHLFEDYSCPKEAHISKM